jgi:hypothetical protein
MFFLLLMLKISKSSNNLLGNNCFKNQGFFYEIFQCGKIFELLLYIGTTYQCENEITILLKQ